MDITTPEVTRRKMDRSPQRPLISQKSVGVIFAFTLLVMPPILRAAEDPIEPDDPAPPPESNHAPHLPLHPKLSTFTCNEPSNSNGRVYLSCKGYNTIPTDAPKSSEIQILDMSGGNHFQTLTTGQLAAAKMPKLYKLILKNCQIRTIHQGAFKAENVLSELDLSNNQIDILDPRVFDGLPMLKMLILSDNPIYRFETGVTFPNIGTLTSLDLSRCNLTQLPDDAFKGLPSLKKLSLESNGLTRVSWRVFRSISENELKIGGNPWVCDCHVNFLIETLRERRIHGLQQATCATPGKFQGMKWDTLPQDELTCEPKIHHFDYKSYSGIVHHENNDIKATSADNKEPVRLGDEVHFECEYAGYPQPEVTWYKDGKPVQFEQSLPRSLPSESEDSTGSEDDRSPRVFVQNLTRQLVGDELATRNNDQFRDSLVLRKVNEKDHGYYACSVSNKAGSHNVALLLNLTAAEFLATAGPGGWRKGGMPLWAILLIAVLCLCVLLLAFCLVILGIRRREKAKQEGFRKVVKEKLMDSKIDLDLDIKPTAPQTYDKAYQGMSGSEGATPLLENPNENSAIVMSMLADHRMPDLTHGNMDLVRNSQIFSPNPPLPQNGYQAPTDARREFFARQISEPYVRPGSAMSLTRPSAMDAAQRRYVFANQNMHSEPPVPGQEPQYAIPYHLHSLPRSNSAMAMSAIPPEHYDLRRQMFLRQNSQPSYATAMRIPRRNPSVSSEAAADTMSLGAYNYSTLPRRPRQNWSRPVSPANSTCSSYSTLSWRPAAHPITGVIQDGVGARTTANGGSNLSINKIPDFVGGGGGTDGLDSISRGMNNTPTLTNGKVMNGRAPRIGVSKTPNSLTRGYNDFFSFEPIQEVEGSESASTNTLDKSNVYPTPTRYTQSLSREPRYKKKKPPPIKMLPPKHKLAEPSRAFDHLRGRSTSPAAQKHNNPESTNQSEVDSGKPKEAHPKPSILLENKAAKQHEIPSILESTIDDEGNGLPPSPSKQAPKIPPPPPPPKPKRSPAMEGKSEEDIVSRVDGEATNVPSVVVNDGTVV